MLYKHRMGDQVEPPRPNEVKTVDGVLICVQCGLPWYECDDPRMREDGSLILEPPGTPL